MASVIPSRALAPKAVVAELSRPGPYPVLRGELALVGLPGVVFTPETGTGLPAVLRLPTQTVVVSTLAWSRLRGR